MIKDKIFTDKDKLREKIEECVEKGQRIVFTNGCFDILHFGHVSYLEKAKSEGDCLVVGVNSDSSVKRLKGENRPVNHEDDRTAVLAALESVSYVIIFKEDTPIDLIKLIKPDVLVKGGDWKPEEIVGSDFVSACGGKVKTIKFEDGRSTTNVIERIRES
ncbi:MAG: D-glycero-beta-D-manno-heptose 1-phosphate adenylyltransferase [Candidatus Cloacimonadota bacterium]|nr:MAG: D-glycero-beta-D-manno-heptose 1-phosphate adenylyltransferase [Candidatus Cloacimonadota bacterium]